RARQRADGHWRARRGGGRQAGPDRGDGPALTCGRHPDMRVTSGLWVGAFVRRAFGRDAPAVIVRRGAEEAGAIFIVVDRLDGTADLYQPAPQSAFETDGPGERLFERRLERAEAADIDAVLDREAGFDPDIWVVAVEDRQGTCPVA